MKKIVMIGLLLAILMPGLGSVAMAAEYRKAIVQFVDERGEPRTDLTYVAVYVAGSATAATLKSEQAGTTAVTNPMTLSSTATGLRPENGLCQFYIAKTKYDIVAHVGGREVSFKGVKPSDTYFQIPHIAQRSVLADQKGSYIKFSSQPVECAQASGLVPAVTNDIVNLWMFPQMTFECRNTLQQDVVFPTYSTSGLDIAMDNTNNDGIELNNGILTTSQSAFTVGTDGPFHFKVRMTLSDVSGTDMCFIGFRKTQAYDDAIATYTDIAGLNVISGTIYTYTNLDDAASPTSTSTTDTWADTATKTLGIYVDLDGAVTYTINGVAPTATTAFSLNADDVVVPFIYFLHDTDVCDDILLVEWDCGLDD